jgi:hypothetical protein
LSVFSLCVFRAPLTDERLGTVLSASVVFGMADNSLCEGRKRTSLESSIAASAVSVDWEDISQKNQAKALEVAQSRAASVVQVFCPCGYAQHEPSV